MEIWGNTCAIHLYLDPLIKLQKKCIRIITFSDELEHTSPLFEQLDILCFNKLVIHRMKTYMYPWGKGKLCIELFLIMPFIFGITYQCILQQMFHTHALRKLLKKYIQNNDIVYRIR